MQTRFQNTFVDRNVFALIRSAWRLVQLTSQQWLRYTYYVGAEQGKKPKLIMIRPIEAYLNHEAPMRQPIDAKWGKNASLNYSITG